MTDGRTPPPDHGPDAMPEGEEQAPPGTRTMAIVRWALVGLMALAAVAAWVDHVRSASSGQQAAGAQFICPMHPQIVTTHKGECPICGMDLVPAGEKGAAAASAHGAEARYTCPMHPAFVTADPKARCPDCGMKLVPVPGAEAAAPAAAPAGPPVPGVAPVELSADRVQLIGMRSVQATREPLASTIRATGYVAASESSLVSVNVRYSGWVEQLAVGQTGQLVQKGEVLASVYSPEMLNAQQVFLNAIKWSDRRPGGSAQTPAIANDLERDARVRLELLGVSPQDVDMIAEMGQPLRAINVRSPVRGYVSRKSVLKGLYVQSGTELFQIADLSSVWVLVDVYESEIPRVKVGQRAAFELKAYPGRRFNGRVQFIYPALNTASRTLQARVELPNPALELRPGMFGDVTLDLGEAAAVTIPKEALIDTGERQYVFVDRGGGRYEPRPIEVGWTGEDKVAVLAGLAEGERVVTTANFLLDSESRLRAAVEGFAAPGGHKAGAPDKPPAPVAAPHDHAGHAHPKGEAMPMKAPAPKGEDLPMKVPAPNGGGARAELYACSMHPEFVTPDPKARCPQCGMAVVPKAQADAAAKGGAMNMPAGQPMKMTAGEPMKMPAGEPMKMPAGEPMKMPDGEPMKPPAGEPMKMPAGGAMPAGEAAPPSHEHRP